MEIFKLFGSIFVDTSKSDESLDNTGKKADAFGEKFGAVAAGVGKAAIGIATAAAGIAAAMGNVAMKSAEAGDRVDKMSQKLGLSREGFQEWDYILSQNGASIDSFGVGMKTLQNQMDGLNQGTKGSQELFSRLGISFDEVAASTPEEAMALVIKRLQEMPEGAEKTALALDAFGKQGMELMPMLNQTAEGTEELRQRAHELGMVMSDEAVDAGVVFGDTLDDVKGMLSGLANTMGAELLPSLTSGLEAFIGFVTGAEGAEEKMQSAFDGIVSAITEKIPQFVEKGSQVVLSLVEGLAGALPSLVTGVMEVVPTIITTIMEMLPDILQAGIGVLTALVTGIAEALPELIPVAVNAVLTLIETLIDNVDLLVDAAIAIVVGLAEGIINALPVLIEKAPEIVAKLIAALIENAPKLLTAAVEIIATIAKGIIDNLPKVGAAAGEIIAAVVTGAKGLIGNVVDVGKNIVEGFWKGISGAGDWLKGKVKGFFGGVVDGVKNVFGIASPSKVFSGIAQNLGESFVNKMESMQGAVGKAMDDVFGGLDKEITAKVTPVFGDMPEFSPAAASSAANAVGRDVPVAPSSEPFSITIQNMTVRDDSDIERIARELYLLQERTRRGGLVYG